MCAQRIFLLATGSFNPPTIMHLRIMELARDHLRKLGFNVIGGALTPVHDGYGKKGLMPARHRVKMTELAVQNVDWVKASSWEALENDEWTRTRVVVDHHQDQLNKFVKGDVSPTWLPDNSVLLGDSAPIQLKVLCGADYLESFNVEGLWGVGDMVKLVEDYGLVVISREGNDPYKSIYKNDILHQHKGNIHIVHEWIDNGISSTKVRCALRRSESIRYIVPDPVIQYIEKEKLYQD